MSRMGKIERGLVEERSQSKRSAHRISDDDMRKVEAGIFEYQTLLNIQKLQDRGALDELFGPISTGKEADVLVGKLDEDPVAVKIYRHSTAFFKNISIMQYIRGDERFKKINPNTRNIVNLWAQKEYKNLLIAQEAKINSPKPLGIEKNIIVMEFIGGDSPAPQLTKYKMKNPQEILDSVLEQAAKLYKKGLVHADLSEYNILMQDDKPYFIDFSQSVLLTHPMAEKFLERDVQRISQFFSKNGITIDETEVLKRITKNERLHKDTRSKSQRDYR